MRAFHPSRPSGGRGSRPSGVTGVQTRGICANDNAGSRFGFDQGFDVFSDDLQRVSYPNDPGRVPAEEVTREDQGLWHRSAPHLR